MEDKPLALGRTSDLPKKSFKVLLNGSDLSSWGGTNVSQGCNVTFKVDLTKVLDHEDLNKVYNMSFSMRRKKVDWYGTDAYLPNISFLFNNSTPNNVLIGNKYINYGSDNFQVANLAYKTEINNKNGIALAFGEISSDEDNKPLQITNLANLTGIRFKSSFGFSFIQGYVGYFYFILTFVEA
jgi:hypothetical protein